MITLLTVTAPRDDRSKYVKGIIASIVWDAFLITLLILA